MKGLYRGFCRNENGTETIVLNGEKIKGDWVQGNLFVTTLQYPNKEVKEYHIYDSYIGIGEDDLPCYQSGLDEIVLPETVCEAVRGLTDRNGKQVFEGDIVATKPLNKISVGYKNNYIGKVIWTTEGVGSCGCCYPSFKGCGFVLEGKYERLKLEEYCEVIGTIFDEQFAEGV